MLVISDVHHAVASLRALSSRGDRLLILGDLVNLTDYRTGEGAIADVLGGDFASRVGDARAKGDFRLMRDLWTQAASDPEQVRKAILDRVNLQYDEVADALEGCEGWAIHGNVDVPEMFASVLPAGIEYVHGEKREIEGLLFGFAGGGVTTPVNAAGEVSDEEMAEILDEMGPVDVLCSHVPPAIEPLRTDAITGRSERGSQPLLDYIRTHQPRFHLFGDVHQPQASRWRIGATECRNVGYFRATGKAFEFPARG